MYYDDNGREIILTANTDIDSIPEIVYKWMGGRRYNYRKDTVIRDLCELYPREFEYLTAKEIDEVTYNHCLSLKRNDDIAEALGAGQAAICGYGIRSARVFEHNGKYYGKYTTYSSCD